MVNAQDQVVTSRRRLVALALGAAVLVSPALRDHDSFPLSTYPVYASARAREATFVTARGRRADGSVQRLTMHVIARTDDPLIAASRVALRWQRAVWISCVPRSQHVRRATSLQWRCGRERHDVVDAARGEESMLEHEELARCTVPS